VLVPTATLKQGILRFRDNAGNIVSYNLATSTSCGTTGTSPCDPRALGISPTIQAMYALEPTGNNPSLGDGLNTTGYSSAVPNPLSTNYYLIRLDHNITSNWKANVNYNYFNSKQTTSTAISLVGATPQGLQLNPVQGVLISGVLTGVISPTLVNVTRFSWLHDFFGPTGITPTALAQSLNLPGTNSPAGFVNLTTPTLLNAPAGIPSHDLENDHNIEIADDLTKTWNQHTVNFGVDIRHLRAQQAQRDITTGLRATLGTGSNLTIPSANTPPVCTATLTANCLPSSQVANWGALYATTLGMIDNNSAGVVFNNNLSPDPFGTFFTADESHFAYQFYAQDTWRITHSLTLNYGLTYGWQNPPEEANGRFAIMTNLATGQRLPAGPYIAQRIQAADSGQFFAPLLGWVPIRQLGGPAYHTDWGDVAPRFGFAWTPSFSNGLLGKALGRGSNVIRGGFGIYYDRVNEINNVILDTLGVGYSRVFQVAGPKCSASGAPGAGCNAGGSNPGLSWYRVGVDGNVPTPVVPPATVPIVPANPLGQATSFLIDPNVKNAKNYIVSLSVQHQLPARMVLEVGFSGNYGRRLAQNVNYSAVPYFMKDPNSSQTLAQAFDAVATQLRKGVAASAVTPQPFFEDLLAGTPLGTGGPTYTQNLAASQATNFINGNLGTLIYNGVDLPRLRAGLPVIDNLQVENNYVRTDTGESNYNALFVTLRKQMGHGLTFDFSYTFSRADDDAVFNQDTSALSPNTYYPSAVYGPSTFDRTHVINGSFVYDLPFGKGALASSHGWINKIAGGWYMSGIFTKYSGLPLLVTEGAQVWGEGTSGTNVAAIPVGARPSTGTNSGVAGSGGIGTSGNPAAGGTGLNLFSNPAAAFAGFRPVLISQDTRDGHGDPMRGLPFWNFDAALGKSTGITERLKLTYAFQFFNLFNNVNFVTPALSLTSPSSFGVITNQFVPNNRQVGSRWIEFSMRLDF
jgi:hypothetical protein